MDTRRVDSPAGITEQGSGARETRGQSIAGAGVREYGAKDCYDDCIKAFRYDDKEKPECARACGLGDS